MDKQKVALGRTIDITGQRFGKIVALYPTGKNAHGGMEWMFRCDCGEEFVAMGRSAVRGNTKSCGCLRREVNGERLRAVGRANAIKVGYENLLRRAENGECVVKICAEAGISTTSFYTHTRKWRANNAE